MTETMPVQLSTFRLENEWFGVDVLSVQEVMTPLPITRVPIAADYVQGLINVRGVIVTVLSLKHRLGFTCTDYDEDYHLLIVNTDDGLLCLQVDEIGDVIETAQLSCADAPATVSATTRNYLIDVLKMDGRLISHLDIARLTEA